jgi:hypothetical protein
MKNQGIAKGEKIFDHEKNRGASFDHSGFYVVFVPSGTPQR